MKAGELQRTMSLLWFSLNHVIMTLHTQTKWRLVSSLVYLKFSTCLWESQAYTNNVLEIFNTARGLY